MTHTPEPSSNIDGMTFEESFAELERIVREIENGDVTLSQTVERYERGQRLATHCDRLLETAQLRVSKLNQDGSLSAL